MNDKFDRFKQLVLEEALQDQQALRTQVAQERSRRLREAEEQIKRETDEYVQERARAITSETGREISRRMLADKRAVAAQRETIAADVREVLDKLRSIGAIEE